jgi:hypothetical protein
MSAVFPTSYSHFSRLMPFHSQAATVSSRPDNSRFVLGLYRGSAIWQEVKQQLQSVNSKPLIGQLPCTKTWRALSP